MEYEMVEIGVGDYDIASERVGGLCLLVEPNPIYYRQLAARDIPRWTISPEAVGGETGRDTLFYVSQEEVMRCSDKLPWYLGGCSTIRKPSPELLLWAMPLIQTISVDVLTLSDLFLKYDVTGMKILKLSMEGHDEIAMFQYLKIVEERPELLAHYISYKNKWFSLHERKRQLEEALEKLGYVLDSHSQEITTIAMLKLRKRK